MQEISGHSIVSGIKWTSASAIAKVVLGLLINIYLVRFLGPELWGILTILLLIATIMIQFSNAILNSAITYFVSKYSGEEQKNYSTRLMFYKLIIILVIAGPLFLLSESISTVFNASNYLIYFQAFVIYFILGSMFNTYQSLFYGLGKFKASSTIDFLSTLIKFGTTLLLLQLGFALKGALIGLSAGFIFGIILMAFFAKGFFTLKPKKVDNKEIWSYNLHSGITNIFSIALTQTDLFVIGILLGPISAGIYNIALIVIVSLSTLFSTLTNVLTHSFTKLRDEKEKLLRFFNKSLYYGFAVAVPMMFGITLIAPQMINFFFGLEYLNAVIPMSLLSYTFIDTVIMACFSALVISEGKVSILSKSSCVAAISNVILNVLFIEFMGIIGAAIAIIFSKIIMYLALIKLQNKTNLRIGIPSNAVNGSFVSSLIMFIVLCPFLPLVTDYFSLTLLVLGGIFIYFAAQRYIFKFDFKKLIKLFTKVEAEV